MRHNVAGAARIGPVGWAVLLLATAAQAQPTEVARAQRLARHALSAAANTVVEVRPGQAYEAGRAGMLTFGTRAISSGEPGICAADVIEVPPPAWRRENPWAFPPARVETRFRVVGPIDVSWSKAEDAGLNSVCAGQHRAWDFFHAENGNVAWDGAEVARQVKLALQASQPDEAARIDLSKITYVDERRCDARDNQLNGVLCISVLIQNSPLKRSLDNGTTILAKIHREFTPRTAAWRVAIADYQVTIDTNYFQP